MPLPVLVRPPVPLTMPSKVVLVLAPPVVSVWLPSVTPPLPVSEPMVSLPDMSSVAPLDTVTALLSPMPPLALSVPAPMLVAPL